MAIRDARARQRRRKYVNREVRMPPRSRHGADVDKVRNAVRLQEPDERFKRARRMTDRVNDLGRARVAAHDSA